MRWVPPTPLANATHGLCRHRMRIACVATHCPFRQQGLSHQQVLSISRGCNFFHMWMPPRVSCHPMRTACASWANSIVVWNAECWLCWSSPVVKFGDGWSHWPSNTTGNWGSLASGPKRDVVAELYAAARARGLKVGIHFELAEWLDAATLAKVLPADRALYAVDPVRYVRPGHGMSRTPLCSPTSCTSPHRCRTPPPRS
jgi:hypothetical protein